MGRSFNTAAKKREPAFLFFDEVQNLDAWAPQIKNLVDNHSVRVLVTGSSSLRIEAGRDSLAGRITSLDIGPLLLREIAELRFGQIIAPCWPDNGLQAIATPDFWHGAIAQAAQDAALRQQAFEAFSARGAYPIAHQHPGTPWHDLADHLNETVIQRRPSSTICAWDREARDATKSCLRKFFASAAATPGNRRAKTCWSQSPPSSGRQHRLDPHPQLPSFPGRDLVNSPHPSAGVASEAKKIAAQGLLVRLCASGELAARNSPSVHRSNCRPTRTWPIWRAISPRARSVTTWLAFPAST